MDNINDEKPVNLHFFIKDDADNFAKICNDQLVKCCIRHDPEGYYVKTDPVTLPRRRALVKAWAAVSVQ